MNPFISNLVLFRVGTYREIMNMDLEDAIKTYSIFFIDYKNHQRAIEKSNEHSKRI